MLKYKTIKTKEGVEVNVLAAKDGSASIFEHTNGSKVAVIQWKPVELFDASELAGTSKGSADGK